MKKSFYTLLVMFLAVITSQKLCAQDANVIYTADFSQGMNNWTPEGQYANQGLWDASSGALNVYGYMATGPFTSYIASPSFTLGAANNTVTFDHQGFYFQDMAREALLVIREKGGEWTVIEGVNYPANQDYSKLNSGILPIPDNFNGKEVEVGFGYNLLSTEFIGNWLIYNITVSCDNSGTPGNKEEAGLSFDVTEATYTIGDGDFNAPVLNNPNSLDVFYASDNEGVATVDAEGNVTIISDGTTVISATSNETADFKKGEAHYTLTVKDPSIVYSAKFEKDNCGFTEESVPADKKAWSHVGWDACMMADAYEAVSEMTDFYLISPEFTLDETENTISYDQSCSYFTNIEEQAQLLIREVGGNWINVTGITYPTDEGVTFHNSGIVAVPSELNGKTVQVAFRYVSDGLENSGIWFLRNLVVKKTTATGIENAAEEESEDGKIYDLQGRKVNTMNNGVFIINGKKVVVK